MKHITLKPVVARLPIAVIFVIGLSGTASAADYTNGSGTPYEGDGLISWVDGERWTDWPAERAKREKAIWDFLNETDSGLAAEWGFRQEGYAQTPKLGWKWFEESPIGFGGVPYVLLKTIIDLNESNCEKANLCSLVKIWHKETPLEDDPVGAGEHGLDHLGFGPHPVDYMDGIAVSPADRKWPLPYGFVFQSGNAKYDWDDGPYNESIDTLDESTYEFGKLEWQEFKHLRRKSDIKSKIRFLRILLRAKKVVPKPTLLLAKAKEKFSHQGTVAGKEGERADSDYADMYEDDYRNFGKSTGVDRVFFSCAACHVGRVLVNDKGATPRVVHLPGSPNTEAEAQYFSQLLMKTGAALVKSGLDIESCKFANPENIEPNKDVIANLYKAMIDKVLNDPGSFYGDSDAQRLRAHFMVWRVAWNFPQVIKDIIGTAVKTHFIYKVVAGQYSYNVERQISAGRISEASEMPDFMHKRTGQMDAFGIASGLAAIHTKRPDQSFLRFMYRDVVDEEGIPVLGEDKGVNPVFTGFKDMEGELAEDLSGLDYENQIERAGNRVFNNLEQWVPPVATPIDIKSLNFSRDRKYANWDGNQGASARALASGTSATGDPKKVNVEIHEPLNPLINHLPPMPYQWDIDLAKAERGRALFFGELPGDEKKRLCSGCHKQRNSYIFPVKTLKVDPWRTTTNTSVSRNMLAALVLEGCEIYRNNNLENPGKDFCLPEGASQAEKLNDYFADVPARVTTERNGYTDMVGFEWAEAPATRYNSPYETVQYMTYDTRQLSRSNSGHEFSSHLCPDLTRLDPVQDRATVAKRILNSPAGDLLEYLKTL